MTDVEQWERELTLTGAVARFEELRLREALADPDSSAAGAGGPTRAELLEALALGEAIRRKAAYGRQLTVRAARAAGASWAEIGRALGISRQSAWELHQRWIDGQAAGHGRTGEIGFDPDEARAARALAGDPD